MGSIDRDTEVWQSLQSFDAAFVQGDIDLFGSLLHDQAQLMWHNRETIEGREAVIAAFHGLFESMDTSAWDADHHTVEIHDDSAYVLSDFTETLLPYDGSPGRRISGRSVLFFRYDGGRWLITRLLSARSAPEEEVIQ